MTHTTKLLPTATTPTASPPALNRLLSRPSPRPQRNNLSDSQLLRPEEAVLPFDPAAEAFLQNQLAWAQASDQPLTVRLLTGPSGSGKTRLALEMCQRLQAQGWQTGFLQGDSTDAATLGRLIWDAQHHYCVVLEEAEIRQPVLLALLHTVLANREASQTPVQVRVLLLARDGGDWWNLLSGHDSDCSGPIPVPPLYASTAARQVAYQLALRSLAERKNIAPPTSQPDLSDALFAHPLHLQMAALLALRGEIIPPAGALAHTVLAHEQGYWQQAFRHLTPANDTPETAAALLMALATLCKGIMSDRDIEPLWRALGQDKAQLKALFKALTPLYPERQGLQGLHPDLLGEALVAQALRGPHGADILDAVLSKGDASVRHSSLTVLAHLLQTPADDLTPLLEAALGQHLTSCASELMAVGIENPSPLIALTERVLRQLPKQQRWQIAGAVGKKVAFNVLPLLGLKVLLCENALEKAKQKLNPDKPQTLSDYAAALLQLSVALHYHGAPEAALSFSQEAVTTYGTLAQGNPERFEPDWALALNNYASDLADQGQHDAAWQAAQQAQTLYTCLASSQPARYVYEQERARLSCALWQWLATQVPMQEALNEPLLPMPTPEEERDLAFQWAVLSAFAQTATAQGPNAGQAALHCWATLDPEQQHGWEDFYFLLTALTERQLNAAAPADWRAQWDNYSAKNQGRPPIWMAEVARRLGLSL